MYFGLLQLRVYDTYGFPICVILNNVIKQHLFSDCFEKLIIKCDSTIKFDGGVNGQLTFSMQEKFEAVRQ